MQYYKSYDFIGHLAVAVIGIRDGKQISYEDFSFLKLPYPEIEEQQKSPQSCQLPTTKSPRWRKTRLPER